MTDESYEDFRYRIEQRAETLTTRTDDNELLLHQAHDRFERESNDIRGELGSLVTAVRLLKREPAVTRPTWDRTLPPLAYPFQRSR